MKLKTRFLSGALALAMGLSFVAPSFADKTEVYTTSVLETNKSNESSTEAEITEMKTTYDNAISKINSAYKNKKNEVNSIKFTSAETFKNKIKTYLSTVEEKVDNAEYIKLKIDTNDNEADLRKLYNDVIDKANDFDINVQNNSSLNEIISKIEESSINKDEKERFTESASSAFDEERAFNFDDALNAYREFREFENSPDQTELNEKKKVLRENIKKLKEAVNNNEVMVSASKLLLKNYPKVSASFKGKLQKLQKESATLISQANKAIEQLEAKLKGLE